MGENIPNEVVCIGSLCESLGNWVESGLAIAALIVIPAIVFIVWRRQKKS